MRLAPRSKAWWKKLVRLLMSGAVADLKSVEHLLAVREWDELLRDVGGES